MFPNSILNNNKNIDYPCLIYFILFFTSAKIGQTNQNMSPFLKPNIWSLCIHLDQRYILFKEEVEERRKEKDGKGKKKGRKEQDSSDEEEEMEV